MSSNTIGIPPEVSRSVVVNGLASPKRRIPSTSALKQGGISRATAQASKTDDLKQKIDHLCICDQYNNNTICIDCNDNQCVNNDKCLSSIVPDTPSDSLEASMQRLGLYDNHKVNVTTNTNTDECICNSTLCLCATKIKMIVDSGATSNFNPYADIFVDYENIQSKALLGDQSKSLDILGKGNLDVIGETYHVPSLTYGLISVADMDLKGYVTIFGGGKCTVINKHGITILTATLKNKLYFLDDIYVRILCSTVCKSIQANTATMYNSGGEHVNITDNAMKRIRLIPVADTLMISLHR